MKTTCISLLLSVLSLLATAQSLRIEKLAELPMKTSNNSVVEGYISGKPYVYSFAGIDESKIYSGIHLRAFRLDVTENEWEEIAPLPDDRGGKIACSATRVGDIIYIIGGYHVAANGSEVSSSKVHRYDVINNVYLADGADIPVPIDDQVQVAQGTLIYVITGWSNNGNRPIVQVYDTENDTWAAANFLPGGNSFQAFGASGVIQEGVIYYYGGAQGSGFPARSELRKGVIDPNDPLQIEWTQLRPDNSEPSYRSAAAVFGDKVGWIGGSTVSYNYNGIAYNGSGGVEPSGRLLLLEQEQDMSETWMEVPEVIPMDLRSLADLSPNEKIIVGGMSAGQTVTNETLLITYEGPSSTENTNQAAKLSLYPNPASEFLTIKRSSAEMEIFSCYDSTGRMLRQLRMEGMEQTVDVSTWESGIYILKSEGSEVIFEINR